MGCDGWVVLYDKEKLLKVLNRFFKPNKFMVLMKGVKKEPFTWESAIREFSFENPVDLIELFSGDFVDNFSVRYYELTDKDNYYKDWLRWITKDYFFIDPFSDDEKYFTKTDWTPRLKKNFLKALELSKVKEIRVWT